MVNIPLNFVAALFCSDYCTCFVPYGLCEYCTPGFSSIYFPFNCYIFYCNLICMWFSALKYSTAVPVIFLSALKYHVLPDRWTHVYRRLWLFSSVVISLYSFYWDVTHDWDLRYDDMPLFLRDFFI